MFGAAAGDAAGSGLGMTATGSAAETEPRAGAEPAAPVLTPERSLGESDCDARASDVIGAELSRAGAVTTVDWSGAEKTIRLTPVPTSAMPRYPLDMKRPTANEIAS